MSTRDIGAGPAGPGPATARAAAITTRPAYAAAGRMVLFGRAG